VLDRAGHGLIFIAFDLIFIDGEDLRLAPIEERRARLRRLIPLRRYRACSSARRSRAMAPTSSPQHATVQTVKGG
jgi:ATP-dependent DNA ligase